MRGGHNRITPIRERAIVADYALVVNGTWKYEVAEVAAKHGIDVSTLNRLRRRHGLRRYTANKKPLKRASRQRYVATEAEQVAQCNRHLADETLPLIPQRIRCECGGTVDLTEGGIVHNCSVRGVAAA